MFLKRISLLVCSLYISYGHTQTITNYTVTDGLVSDNVICVAVDQLDELWFGTQAGVSNFDGTTWTTYESGTFTGMADDNIQAIFIDSNNDPWIGTDFGVSVFNGTSWTTYTSTDGLGNEQIKCIGEDAGGDMWFGTSGGASRFDGTTWTNYGTADGIPFGGVNSITLKANGDLWLGTGLSGVRIYDGTTFNPITAANDGLINDRVRTIAFESNNKSWVGTTDGITVLSSADVFTTNYTTIFMLPSPDTLNPIEDIKIDGNGNVWVGVYVDYLVTEGGVSVFNGNQWIQFDVSDGLVGPVVRAIAITSADDVWVVTSTGISKISNLDYLSTKVNVTESAFSIYPNPANENFIVKLNKDNSSDQIDIFDASMQIVKSKSLNSASQVSFSAKGLAKGVYFVRSNNQTSQLIIR